MLFILFADFAWMVVVVGELVEEDGGSWCFRRLPKRLDFALFLSVLDIAIVTSVLSYPFMNIIQKCTSYQYQNHYSCDHQRCLILAVINSFLVHSPPAQLLFTCSSIALNRLYWYLPRGDSYSPCEYSIYFLILLSNA
jgi:hypothetical protein